MIANCVNTGGKSLNITNMKLLITFNETREIFASVTRVLSICEKVNNNNNDVNNIL